MNRHSQGNLKTCAQDRRKYEKTKCKDNKGVKQKYVTAQAQQHTVLAQFKEQKATNRL